MPVLDLALDPASYGNWGNASAATPQLWYSMDASLGASLAGPALSAVTLIWSMAVLHALEACAYSVGPRPSRSLGRAGKAGWYRIVADVDLKL